MNKQRIFSIIKNIMAVVVIISMFVIIFYQNRDRDIFKFGKDESSSLITTTQDGAEESTGGDVKRIGDKVAYLTTTSLRILDENAKGENVQLALSNPLMHTESEYAACYNEDSTEVSVYKNEREYYSVKLENNILRAKVNENGYLFTATEKEGYNCECMVFNRNGEAIFKWDVSKSEFLDGDINCNNDLMAISLAAAGNEKLLGEVVLIDITDAKVVEKQSFESKIFYCVDFNRNDTFTALGSHCLTYFNADGTEKWSYDYGKDSLIKAEVSNPDMMVVAFAAAGSVVEGNSTTVRVINRLGKVIAEKSYPDIIDDIALSDNAIALAFGKTIYVTNSDLREKKTVKTDSGVKKIALFDDNEHLFVISASGGGIME